MSFLPNNVINAKIFFSHNHNLTIFNLFNVKFKLVQIYWYAFMIFANVKFKLLFRSKIKILLHFVNA